MTSTDGWCLPSQQLSTVIHSKLGVSWSDDADGLWTTSMQSGIGRGRCGYNPARSTGPSAVGARSCGTLGTTPRLGATALTCPNRGLSTIHTPYNHYRPFDKHLSGESEQTS